MRRPLALLACGALALGLAACGGDDDGETVRDCGASGSEAASGSETASGSEVASSSSADCADAASSSGGEPVCDPFGNLEDADTTVNVELSEFAVKVDQTSVPAGKVHFAISNLGAEPHELVVVRASVAADLPVDEHGVLDEEALPEGAFVGEVGAFPAAQTCDGTFDLAAGDYLLLCNLVESEEGTPEYHLPAGMVTPFTVT